ncbi:MAG: DUF2344 domain-containing protein [Planctomycetes bacterium]|nr:DUF2344 domain-containing protein [Planctomycetota bacterium]
MRFEKRGALKYISHHDLMRVFELALRRAGIRVAHSRGFNPRPKLSFALALPLGVESLDEVLDIDLEAGAGHDAKTLLAQLGAQLPPGLKLLDAKTATGRPRVTGCEYRCELKLDEAALAELAGRLQTFLSQASAPHARSRGAGKTPRRLDVRLLTQTASLEGNVLQMRLFMTPQGGIKPSDLLEVLGLDPLAHFITKTKTLLEEVPATETEA